MPSLSSIISYLALAATALGAPSGDVTKRAQTVYLAGDSTMTKWAAGSHEGWGVYLPYSLSLPVVNKAIGGRSSRSFTVEGRFDEIVKLVKPNDIVIIEFGHNDGGSLSTDNGRSVCAGAGDEVCQSTYQGKAVTVRTYPWYLKDAGKKLIAKGAKVIFSSPTPNNPWETGKFIHSPSRYYGYAQQVAKDLGASAFYVNHGGYTADIFQSLGKPAVDALFPTDHTHTSPKGADIVSKAFVKALKCDGSGFLEGFVKNATASIPGKCL